MATLFLRNLKVLGAMGSQEQHDDVSWVFWEIPDSPVAMGLRPSGESGRDASLEPGLTFSLKVHPDRSPIHELLPQIVRLVAGQGVNRKELQTLSLLLSEALTNALDHGLLRLDSRLKDESFEAYEAARRQRRAELREGCISLNLQLWHPLQDRRRIAVIQVQVADSGPGFDWKARLDDPAQGQERPSGRGLLLLRSLALRVAFNQAGNQISFDIECS
jgi:anti-sigma regulatory factor (Ser/Thr protein kinase)